MTATFRKPVVIIGGGPAGSVAALCLRKLGHEVVIYEKLKFPRYRIGESLLPGTCSILTRLDVYDKVAAAAFTKKRAATFIWGGGVPPWSFTFATPKTAPWTFDHALQVTRAEFDQILLDAAIERGAEVHEMHEVIGVQLPQNGERVHVKWRNSNGDGTTESDWVIDASGGRGVLAQHFNLRRFDEYYKNMAVWSYFKGGKRFKGDLEGNIFSVTWKEGWIWIIPLKGDVYSVGVVTGVESNARMREIGPDAFYHEALRFCPLAQEILAEAKQCDEVHTHREWAYEAKQLSMGRAFLCGDSACFIDPLFSQGVHLATYSAMLAAAAIDYLREHPEESSEVHAWYDRSYRDAYNRYHQFLAGFYACNSEPDSKFWSQRKIQGAADRRFDGKEWFTAMTGQNLDPGAPGVEDLETRAANLAALWQHSKSEITDHFDETELSIRRIRWANQMLKELNRMTAIHWTSDEVRLLPSFKVDPLSFKLERQYFLGNETGHMLRSIAFTEKHQQVFQSLLTAPMSYAELSRKLKELDGQGKPLGIALKLIDGGFLRGFDKDGKPVKIPSLLRFGGVGAEDDIS